MSVNSAILLLVFPSFSCRLVPSITVMLQKKKTHNHSPSLKGEQASTLIVRNLENDVPTAQTTQMPQRTVNSTSPVEKTES